MTLLPLSISAVELGGVPADLPLLRIGLGQSGAVSALRIRLRCDGPVKLSHLDFDRVEFFLSGPDMQALQLLELLMAHQVGALALIPGTSTAPLVLPEDALRQEGFESDQALLPDDLRNFDGYRLLQEYFAFPSRFLFFSLKGLRPLLAQSGDATTFDIIILLDKADDQLERVVDKNHLALHCTPVVNLFAKVAERQKSERQPARIPSGGR